MPNNNDNDNDKENDNDYDNDNDDNDNDNNKKSNNRIKHIYIVPILSSAKRFTILQKGLVKK